MSSLQIPSVLFSFLRFLNFRGPDYLGAWKQATIYTAVMHFRRQGYHSFGQRQAEISCWGLGQEGPRKTQSSPGFPCPASEI